MLRTCRTCKEEFLEDPQKPGFIDECWPCTKLRSRTEPEVRDEFLARHKTIRREIAFKWTAGRVPKRKRQGGSLS